MMFLTVQILKSALRCYQNHEFDSLNLVPSNNLTVPKLPNARDVKKNSKETTKKAFEVFTQKNKSP